MFINYNYNVDIYICMNICLENRQFLWTTLLRLLIWQRCVNFSSRCKKVAKKVIFSPRSKKVARWPLKELAPVRRQFSGWLLTEKVMWK